MHAAPRRAPLSVRIATATLAALAATAVLSISGVGAAAERTTPRAPDAARRDLPPGASEAQVRRYCTRKFEEEAYYIPDKAGGAGGMLTNRLFIEFQNCLRRNGVRP